MRERTPALLLLLVLLTGCAPRFEVESGSLTVDGTAFHPTLCRVLVRATGIELFDAAGTRLELTLPPKQIEAFREMSGTPRATLRRGPRAAEENLGECGSLALVGQGWHGGARRAAKGRMSLSCAGRVSGELVFTDCF